MKHAHYFKLCPYASVDVYRVLDLFKVADPCLQHAVKKLLVAGGRGAGKSIDKDVQEAIDTLERWQQMRVEEQTIAREAARARRSRIVPYVFTGNAANAVVTAESIPP